MCRLEGRQPQGHSLTRLQKLRGALKAVMPLPATAHANAESDRWLDSLCGNLYENSAHVDVSTLPSARVPPHTSDSEPVLSGLMAISDLSDAPLAAEGEDHPGPVPSLNNFQEQGAEEALALIAHQKLQPLPSLY